MLINENGSCQSSESFNYLLKLIMQGDAANAPEVLKEVVRQSISRLHVNEAMIITHIFWDNKTFKEVSLMMNMPLDKVESQYYKSLELLKHLILKNLTSKHEHVVENAI